MSWPDFVAGLWFGLLIMNSVWLVAISRATRRQRVGDEGGNGQ